MKAEKKKPSIITKICVFVAIAVFAAGLIAATISYQINASRVNQYYSELSISTARHVLSMLDAEDLLKLREVCETEEYQELRATAEERDNEEIIEDYLKSKGVWQQFDETRAMLSNYLRAVDDVEYLYILYCGGLGDNRDMSLIDDDTTPLYRTGLYVIGEEELDDADYTMEVPPTISHGEWGWLMSAYVPIYASDGTLVGQVGCDVLMDEVMKERYQSFLYILVVTVLMTILITIGVYNLLKKNVVEPLERTTNSLSRFLPSPDLDPKKSGVIDMETGSSQEMETLYQGIRSMQLNTLKFFNDRK